MTNNTADLILYNAQVFTFDEKNRQAELVAVKDGKILAVTNKSDLNLLTAPNTRLIDCQGMTVIPGFNDAHCHPIGRAITLLHIDCSPFIVKSIMDIKKEIRHRAQVTPPGKWLRAAQYNEISLKEKRHPTRWDLDEAAPDHPVLLVHYSAGICVLNSRALQIVGITRDTNDGIIFGMNAKVQKGIPSLDASELEKGMRLASQQYLANGITSLQDTGWNNSLSHWQTYKKYKSQDGLLPNRISMLIGSANLEEITDNGLSMGCGDNQLRIGGVKIALDESTGQPHPPQAEINQQALMAHLAGFQLAFHVHDQYNLRASLGALSLVLRESPRPFHRHRLEHCMVCTPDLLASMAKLRPMVVTQPSFLHYGGEDFMQTVPHDKLHCLFPLNSFNRTGLQVALSSDSPMLPSNPLIGIYTAVTRKELQGQKLAPEEGISPMDALRMYTLGGAYASFEEDIKGSITPGKFADLVVLSSNPNEVEREELKDIKVMMTIINGKVAWER